jgi:hypothetical protein
MRPKTARRLALLAVVAVVGVGGGLGVIVIRKWRTEQRFDQYRTVGMAAHERGAYAAALDPLNRYLRREQHRDEADVVLAFAESRLEVEEADGSHLVGARALYNEYLGLMPDDREAALKLLGLEIALGLYVEAADRARGLLPGDPQDWEESHIQVLDTLSTAELERQRFSEVERVCARWSEIDPRSVTPHMRMLALFAARDDRAGRRSYVRGLLDEAPDDPTAQLVSAVEIVLSGGSVQEARSLVCAATGLAEDEPVVEDPSRVPEDTGATRVALHVLDTLRLRDHAMVLLEAAPASSEDLVTLRLRRSWQRGRHDRVIEAGADLISDPENAPATALGIIGLSLIAVDRPGEALALADTLEARGRDYLASAWTTALRAAADPALDDSARFEARRAAAAANPYEPVLQMRYASALFDRARYREARQVAADIQSSGDSGPYLLSTAGWPAPILLQAECHLREGDSQAAFELVRSVGSRDASAVALMLEAAVALRDQGRPVGDDLGDLGAVLDSALEMASLDDERARALAERIVVAAVSLMPQTELAGALEKVASADLTLAADTYGRLATIGDAAGLDLDERLRARASGSSAAIMREARELAARGEVEEGERLIEEAFPDDDDLARRVKAVYFEPIDEARAAALWIALADEQPENLERQRQALRARSVSLDADWVETAGRRVEELTGNPLRPERIIRVARARAAARSATTESARDQAIAAFAAVAADYRDQVDLQLELAELLLAEGVAAAPDRDVRLALAALERASVAAPRRFDIALRVARLQARLGDPQAEARLTPLARDQQAPPQVRLEAVAALRDMGRVDQAISILQSWGASDVPSLALLAELYRQRSQDQRAREIYDALAGLPDDQTTPALIERLASFYSSIGETSLAEHAIERLPRLDAGAEQIAAAHASWAGHFGSREQINAAMEAWLEHEPTDVARWYRWMRALARVGASDDVDRVAARAADAVGPDEAVRIEAMKGALGEPTLSAGTLADLAGLAEDPLDREVFAAAGAILRTPARELTPAAWRDLSARYPRSNLAQRLAVQQLAAMGAVNEAIDLGQRQMRSTLLPARPDLPRIVCELLATQGRWNELLEAASVWRARERIAPIEADLAIAQAQIEIGRPARAVAALRPHIQEAELDPARGRDSSLISLYATGLVRSGDANGAVKTLLPMLDAGGPRFRTMVALDVARGIEAEGPARRLVQGVADIAASRALDEPDAIVERLGAALALVELAGRSADPEPLYERATAMIRSVVDAEGVAPEHRMQALVVLGESRLTRGDAPGAREAFTQALESAQPAEKAAVRYRLARAHDADGATEQAVAEVRKAAMDPEAPPQIVLSCANWFESAGAYEDAFAAYDRILSMPNLPRETSAAVGNNLVMAGVAMGVTDAATLRRLEQIARANASDAALPVQVRAEAPSTLGWILLRTGRAEEAAGLFQAQVDAGDDRASVFIGRARALQSIDEAAAGDAAADARRVAADAESIAPWMRGELEKLPQS